MCESNSVFMDNYELVRKREKDSFFKTMINFLDVTYFSFHNDNIIIGLFYLLNSDK